MKKLFAALALVLLAAGVASAQPRAIGFRFGWGGELSFQYATTDYQFIQADLGALSWSPWRNGFSFTATYNFIFSKPEWTPRGEWAWYAGFGAMTGVLHQEGANKLVVVDEATGEKDWVKDPSYNYFILSGAAMFGLEYTFWFPLQVSVDIRPTPGFAFGKGPECGFYWDGIKFGFIPTLSVRYKF